MLLDSALFAHIFAYCSSWNLIQIFPQWCFAFILAELVGVSAATLASKHGIYCGLHHRILWRYRESVVSYTKHEKKNTQHIPSTTADVSHTLLTGLRAMCKKNEKNTQNKLRNGKAGSKFELNLVIIDCKSMSHKLTMKMEYQVSSCLEPIKKDSCGWWWW